MRLADWTLDGAAIGLCAAIFMPSPGGSWRAAAGARAAEAPVSASPMHSEGSEPVYPRLTALSNPEILAKVNAILAKQESDDRATRSDCFRSVRQANRKPGADTYETDISVTYLSAHYLSVNVVSSYDCAGPYPTSGAEAPLTFDLTTGAPITWQALFEPGFLPPDDGEASAHPSVLAGLYKARYLKTTPVDDDCRGVITDPLWSFSPILWLSATGGLVVQPDFPHAVAACAEPLSLSAADLAPYVRTSAFLADLKATIRPAAAVDRKVRWAAAGH
jgi:hypothetical protein